MILDIDIGNSGAKWRLGESRGRLPLSELRALPDLVAPPAGIHVACVRGAAVEQELAALCLETWDIMPVFARVQDGWNGLWLAYERPDKLGVDRWLAMLAAREQTQGAVVVIDAGTAITVDFIDAGGVHKGGLILPGLRLMADSLFSGTHGVSGSASPAPMKWRPGRSTQECVESGVGALINGLIHELNSKSRLWFDSATEFLVCGGDAETVAARDSRLKVAKDLVLDGLALAPNTPAKQG